MTERNELERTRDIFAHIREILERDGDRAEILFNAIQLQMLLKCEPQNTTLQTYQIEAMRDVLEFYADEKRYNGPNQRKIVDDKYTAHDAAYMVDVGRDGGSLARRVLNRKDRQ